MAFFHAIQGRDLTRLGELFYESPDIWITEKTDKRVETVENNE